MSKFVGIKDQDISYWMRIIFNLQNHIIFPNLVDAWSFLLFFMHNNVEVDWKEGNYTLWMIFLRGNIAQTVQLIQILTFFKIYYFTTFDK